LRLEKIIWNLEYAWETMTWLDGFEAVGATFMLLVVVATWKVTRAERAIKRRRHRS
jgi:hypothetical protein